MFERAGVNAVTGFLTNWVQSFGLNVPGTLLPLQGDSLEPAAPVETIGSLSSARNDFKYH